MVTMVKFVAVPILCLLLLVSVEAGRVQKQGRRRCNSYSSWTNEQTQLTVDTQWIPSIWASKRLLAPSHTGGYGSEIMAVRLGTPSRHSRQGLVEILTARGWGLVCDDLFDERDAQVVCRSLGFLTTTPRFAPGNPHCLSPLDTVLDDLQCSGSESSLNECNYRDLFTHNCGPEEAVAVDCGRDPSQPLTPITARLVGPSNGQGRLEVLINGTWGTVCDEYFDENAAIVVCRMLGILMDNFAMVASSGEFGKGDGPILMNEVNCLGYETNLNECSYITTVRNCYHSDDVAIQCTM